MEDQNKLKRIVLSIFFAVALLSLAVYLINIFTTGTIEVSTKSVDDSVSIAKINGEQLDRSTQKQAKGSLKLRLKPGVYKISAFNHSTETSKNITLSRGDKLSFNIPLGTLQPGESVISKDTSSVYVGKSGIFYINPLSLYLKNIDLNNSVATLDSNHTLSDMVWQTSSNALARDTEGVLYGFNGSSLSKINNPKPLANPSTSSYALSANGTIYTSDGGTVNKRSPSGAWSKLYSTRTNSLSLSAYVGGVAVSGSGAADGEGEQNQKSPVVAVINDRGNVLAQRKDLRAYKIAWSPDYKYILAKGDYGTLLLSPSLKLVANVPAEGIGDIVWQNSTKYLYSDNDVIWRYDTASGFSQQVSEKLGGTIENIYVDSAGSYAYASVASEAPDGSPSKRLVRVGLNGQRVASDASVVGLFLPDTAGSCVLDYVNFSRMQFVIYYPPGVDPKNCVNAARSYLADYTIDTVTGDFRFLPSE